MKHRLVKREVTVTEYGCSSCPSFWTKDQSESYRHFNEHGFDDIKAEVKWFGNSGKFKTEDQLKEFISYCERKWNKNSEDSFTLKYEWLGPGEYVCGSAILVAEGYYGPDCFEVWFRRSRVI